MDKHRWWISRHQESTIEFSNHPSKSIKGSLKSIKKINVYLVLMDKGLSSMLKGEILLNKIDIWTTLKATNSLLWLIPRILAWKRDSTVLKMENQHFLKEDSKWWLTLCLQFKTWVGTIDLLLQEKESL